jgi:CheY-like chemotaxis protein
MQPVMDGIETAKYIRETEALRGCKHDERVCIIGMSANGDGGTKNEGLAVGMNSFLEKPVSPNKVVEIINKTKSTCLLTKGS